MRKGKRTAQKIPTIDTGARSTLRIKEINVASEKAKAAEPQKMPRIQKIARIYTIPLRLKKRTADGSLCIKT